MLYLSSVLFILALIAAVLGFGGLTVAAAATVFQVVFFALVVAFVVCFLMGVFQRGI